MDKKKIIVTVTGSILGVALLALLVLWVGAKILEKRAYGGGGQSGEKQNKNTGSNSGNTDWSDFPLKWGSGTSRNKNVSLVRGGVRQIQRVCNSWVKTGLVVDGIWGDKTEAAVQKLKAVKARPKSSGTISGGGYDYSSMVQTSPFYGYISTVQNPASSLSRVQISNQSDYNNIIEWHNAHVNDYVKIS